MQSFLYAATQRDLPPIGSRHRVTYTYGAGFSISKGDRVTILRHRHQRGAGWYVEIRTADGREASAHPTILEPDAADDTVAVEE